MCASSLDGARERAPSEMEKNSQQLTVEPPEDSLDIRIWIELFYNYFNVLVLT
jgi:hypothetical protein